MKKLMMLSILLGFNAGASSVSEIFSVINKISPHLGVKSAKNYARIIFKYSTKYKIDWRVPVAIFKQESDFSIKEVNWASMDFGIGQMNHRNVVKLNIDLGRLLTEEDYAIHESYKLLARLQKRYKTNAKGYLKWYTRYHSFTIRHRKNYYKYLRRKFIQIEKASNEWEKKNKNNSRTN